ncbi:hypothetical protein DENSPDRAFT_846508 [Dentipellis sp. KUC8613]|nr:hypothetical protein DENSPDRAFT_846508 [Dentipellis sp. KUC8613]
MFKTTILLLPMLAAAATLPPWACPAAQPNHLCCFSFGPLGNLTTECGISGFDPSTPSASGFCTSAYNPCLQGTPAAACCEDVIPCAAGEDGPIGVNCVEVEY